MAIKERSNLAPINKIPETHHPVKKITRLQELARHLISLGLQIPFPVYVEVINDAIAKTEALIENGYSVAATINHPHLDDWFRVVPALYKESKEIRSRPTLIPGTQYFVDELERRKVLWVGRKLGIEVVPIMTKSSKEKAKEKKEAIQINPDVLSKFRQIFSRFHKRGISENGVAPDSEENENEAGKLLLEYADRGAKTLVDGGTVVFAPEGGRRKILERPTNKSKGIFQLCRRATNLEADVAILPISVHHGNAEGVSMNMNPRTPYYVVIGEPVTFADAKLEAARRDTTVDEVIYERMAQNLPSHMREDYYNTPRPPQITLLDNS